ncbi:MAG: hypothetical protein M3362_12075 [Acidobacteriota bacterium]|nr:hypothetical protein [Acidobacteriota bacterium]
MSVRELALENSECPQRGGTKSINVHVGTSLRLDVLMELEEIARERNLKLAKIVRHLALRGLAAYRRDGLLDEPVENFYEAVER